MLFVLIFSPFLVGLVFWTTLQTFYYNVHFMHFLLCSIDGNFLDRYIYPLSDSTCIFT